MTASERPRRPSGRSRMAAKRAPNGQPDAPGVGVSVTAGTADITNATTADAYLATLALTAETAPLAAVLRTLAAALDAGPNLATAATSRELRATWEFVAGRGGDRGGDAAGGDRGEA